MNQFWFFLQSIGYTVIVVAYWYLAKFVVDRTTPYNDDEKIEGKKNFAMGLMRAGLYLGIAIGMAGALATGGEHAFWKDVRLLLLDGILIVPFLLLSRLVNDRLILGSAGNDEAIGANNIAVGAAEFGSLVGTGLILHGAFSGEGDYLGSVVFFLLGQLAFVLALALIEKFACYNLRQEIREGNVAGGIFLASKFVALGLIMRISIAGPSLGWREDLIAFAVTALAGIVTLMVFNRIADWIFLPVSREKDQICHHRNPASLMIAAGIEIGLAITVSSVI